jgi:hypothetical protein
VTENHKQPNLGLEGCLEFDLLSVNEDNICALQPSVNTKLTSEFVFERYADLFDGIGKFEGKLRLETDPNVSPVRMPLRRLPVPIKDKVEAGLKTLYSDNIMTPVNEPSDWISALLVINKTQGGVGICTDPKPLNKALKHDLYAMPIIDDILPQLTNCKVFSTADAKAAFWMIEL